MADLKKLQLSAEASNEEVIDSVADAFHIALSIEETLRDGWQLNDLLTFLALEDEGRELVNDAPLFLDQFVKLTPDTAIDAVLKARVRVIAQHGPLTRLPQTIFSILYNAATSYKFALSTYNESQIQVANWRIAFEGGNTIPEA